MKIRAWLSERLFELSSRVLSGNNITLKQSRLMEDARIREVVRLLRPYRNDIPVALQEELKVAERLVST